MRYGHGPEGIIGITLQPSTLKRWALGLHICTQLKTDVKNMVSGESDKTVVIHKEEGSSRIKLDGDDRSKIREKLSECVHPFDPESHPENLINIVSGRISPAKVNVDQALKMGSELMTEYLEGWPQTFNKPLKRPVELMSKQHTKIGSVTVYDTSLIYSRVLCLQKVRDINMQDVLSYELAAFPPSMFDEKTGDMRLTSSKSTLKTKLQVDKSSRAVAPPDAFVLDGCAILWVVRWPNKGTVEDYIRNFTQHLKYYFNKADTYLVFDRYVEMSTKEILRKTRAGKEANRKHQLSLSTPLPAQKVCLSVTGNKSQLIDLFCQYLIEHKGELENYHKLVITGPDPVPQQIWNGQVQTRADLQTTHEEADVIVTQQVSYLARSGKTNITVIADDTDIFVLLLHAYNEEKLNCGLVLSGTSPSRSSTDIKATAEKHIDILEDLLPAHVLSGCDTVSCIWGIGKSTAIKTLKSGLTLRKLGCQEELIADIIAEATKFVASCYGFPRETDMTTLRYKVWTAKMGNHKLNTAPELRVLPPTSETFKEHVLRSHLQAAIWRSYIDANPPQMDPTHYGWTPDVNTQTLVPVAMPPAVSPAPVDVLKMIKCGCSSCATARCSCSAAHLSCSVFCKCYGLHSCKNPNTITDVTADDVENE